MGKITVQINGHPYQLACQDGEEERLESLAAYVDRKLSGLTENLGQVGDTRLLLMTALLITDELAESREKTGGTLEHPDISSAVAVPPGADQMIDDMAKRLESIAARLESA